MEASGSARNTSSVQLIVELNLVVNAQERPFEGMNE